MSSTYLSAELTQSRKESENWKIKLQKLLKPETYSGKKDEGKKKENPKGIRQNKTL